MGHTIPHQDQIFSAIDRRFNAERDRIEAERDLAKAIFAWLASLGDQAAAPIAETTMPAPLLTVEDVAAYFKIKPQTIRDWVRTGRIPFVPVNHEIRFRRSDIENGIRPDHGDQAKENIEIVLPQNIQSGRSIPRPAKNRSNSNGRV